MKATIEKLIEDYRKGKMIILMDDEIVKMKVIC